jgi:hypothetical protein
MLSYLETSVVFISFAVDDQRGGQGARPSLQTSMFFVDLAVVDRGSEPLSPRMAHSPYWK